MFKNLVRGVIISLALATRCGQLWCVQAPLSNRNIGAVHIEQFGAANALRSISQKAQIPIGVEAIVDYKNEHEVKLDFPGGTVADLLNMFVSQAPEYRWDEVEGIIHVFQDAKHLPLADTTISYLGAKSRSRKEIWSDLNKMPEIAAWMNANHCQRQELFNGKEFRAHNAPISIERGTITVSELLDQVAVKSGENYWAILRSSASETACQVTIIL